MNTLNKVKRCELSVKLVFVVKYQIIIELRNTVKGGKCNKPHLRTQSILVPVAAVVAVVNLQTVAIVELRGK